jgi:hypothetical protein
MTKDRSLSMRGRRAARIGGPLAGRLRAGLAGLFALVVLSACTADQSGLRDWSIQAREAVLPLTVTRVGPPSEATPGQVGSDVEANLLLREAAASWLAVLAALADDATLPDAGTALEARALRLQPADPEAAAAAINLARAAGHVARLNWGEAHLAYAIQYGDPFFQPVLAILGRRSEALPSEAASARAAQQGAMARIAEGHALLVQRKFVLGQSDTGRMMRAEASELRRLMAAAVLQSP